MRGRTLARFAIAAQAILLAGALIVPTSVAAATLSFTLNTPTLSTVNYSDFSVLRGAYTCINDVTSVCPTTLQSHTATFSIRPAGGSTFTNVGSVATSFNFTGSAGGCPTTCSQTFQLTWKAGRALGATVAPGIYDVGLTTTISGGQLILLNGITVTPESTRTTYGGLTSAMGNTSLAMSATALDLDLGQSAGTGIFSPDANLSGVNLVSFELFDSTNTTSVAGPVSAFLAGGGSTTGSPTLLMPSSGGTFKLRTTFIGNDFYTTSSDLDTITVTPSNTPPVLTVPAGPVGAEATSPSGATVTFSVSANDAEDNPAPTPTCAPASGSVFALGNTTVNCSVTDSGGLSDTDSFVVHVIDTLDPGAFITTDESDNGAGWYNVASNDSEPGLTVDVSAVDLVSVASLTCTDNGIDVGALDPSGDSFVVGDGSHTIVCTATDGAGNDSSADTTFDVDQTAPSIVASLSSDPDAGTGWWNAATGAPTVTYACDDATSGVASCGDAHLFGDGADQSDTGTATDVAGNTATDSVSGIDVDLTPPSIAASLTPDPDSITGWWNAATGAPSVSFECSDDTSGLAEPGCPGSHLFGEGAGQSWDGTVYDVAGNMATDGVTGVDVDLTAPSISAAVTPDAAASGWWNLSTGAPTVTYSCGDARSGLASCSAPHLFGEGADQGNTGTAVDVAGNSNTASVSNIDVDLTAPSISAGIALADAGTGWWNIATGAPTVTYACADDGSGLASCSTPYVFGDGADQGASGTAMDLAGNSGNASVSNVDVDVTAPSISAVLPPAAAGSGWWNSSTGAPTVTYSCADGGSGLASCSLPHLFGEGADQVATGAAADVAGNANTASVSNVDVDLTAPGSIAFVGGGITNNASYYFGSVPGGPNGCTATDAVSGLASCSVSGYSNLVGPHTITAVAVDNAGNTSSIVRNYTVLPWTLTGFANPTSMTAVNLTKGGANVNLKFQIFAGSTELTSLSSISMLLQTPASCTTWVPLGPPQLGSSSRASGQIFDRNGGQFVAKWDVPSASGSCWFASVVAADGSWLQARFQVK